MGFSPYHAGHIPFLSPCHSRGTMSIIVLFLFFSMACVIFFDITRFIIPNWLVGGLLLLYPVAVALSPTPIDWQTSLICMLAVFAVGYVVFAMSWMGGGDIKLITVLALWVGLEKLPEFMLGFAVLGGILSLSVWLTRKALPFITAKRDTLPRILREGEPVPYGVAIAIAFTVLLYQQAIPAAQFQPPVPAASSEAPVPPLSDGSALPQK
jgi:prepilin peptidase CpaA